MFTVPALFLILGTTSCTCPRNGAGPTTFSDSLSVLGELKLAAAVVLGEVTQADYHGGAFRMDVRYTLRVLEAWKTTDTTIVVSAGFRGNDCGLQLWVGGQFLLYLDRSGVNSTLAGSACSRYLVGANARKDLMLLGPPAYRRLASPR